MSEVEGAVEAAEQEVASPEDSAQEVIESVSRANGEESSEEVDVEDASDEELEDVVDSEEASAEEKAEAAKELKKRLKLKVNGREIEEEIDFNDDDKLREILQKGYAADSKFQEAAGMRKQMDAFIQALQSDPFSALARMGLDPDQLAESHIQKRIEEMQKSPEQLELEKLRKQVENEEKIRKQLEQEKLEAEQARIQEEYSRQLDTEITDALQNSELPKSPAVVERLAKYMMVALENGYEDVTASDVLPIVERQFKQEIRQMFEIMPEDVIEKVLGKDVSTKLRKRRISKAKSVPQTASSVKPTGKSELNKAKADAEANKKPLNSKDFFKNL